MKKYNNKKLYTKTWISKSTVSAPENYSLEKASEEAVKASWNNSCLGADPQVGVWG